MYQGVLFMEICFSAPGPVGPGSAASCWGDLPCPGFSTAFCAVAIPEGGYCEVTNYDTHITCTSYDNYDVEFETETDTCPGIVNWYDCGPSDPWWACQPEYV